jgi:hypothetical protein
LGLNLLAGTMLVKMLIVGDGMVESVHFGMKIKTFGRYPHIVGP